MKKLNLLLLAGVVIGGTSCGDAFEEQGEASQNTTTQTEEIVEEDITQLESAIIADLENEAFASKMTEVEGILIDVRTPDEFNEGHIEGALNLDYNSGQFESYLDSLDSTKPVFVYCQAGGRSGKARDILKDRDFLEVYNLKNGYGNWDQ